MSTTELGKTVITKLNGGNYQLWKFKMEMVLSKDDLWEIVEKDIPDPRTAAWDKRNRLAKATISLLVEDDQLIHVRKHDTAKGMWLALQGLYERSNLNSKLFLLRRIYKMRLDKDQSMRKHINAMLEIVEQLRGIGEDMTDHHVAALLLCSLPESYGTLITALEARPEAELTLELVKGKLMDEFDRRQENYGSRDLASQDSTYESALKAFDDKSKMRGEQRTCYFCERKGHLKRDCRRWKAEKGKRQYNAKAAIDTQDTDEEERALHMCFKVNTKDGPNAWYIDSGATCHMCSDRAFFKSLDTSKTEKVFLADGSHVLSQGTGEGYLECEKSGGDTHTVLVKEVLYVPGLEGNLLSIRKLTALGLEVNFEEDKCTILRKGEVAATAKINSHLYQVACRHKAMKARHNAHENCIHLWHRRLGHRDPAAVKLLHKEMLATGINMSDCKIKSKCTCCIKGKMCKKSFPKLSQHRAKQPLDLIHSDICGPMRTRTPGGNRYMITFVDDYSRYTVTYLIQTKDRAVDKLKEYIAMASNKFQRKPVVLRTDGGGEYIGNEMKRYLKQEGIIHQITTPYSPEQNGVAERKNRSLIEMARCMLLDSDIGHQYWGEAIMTANHLQNRLPTRSCDKTPYEHWNGTVPDLSYIRVFGSKAYAHVPKERRTKFEDCAQEGILVGYSETSKGYRILQTGTNKIIISRSATVEERTQGIIVPVNAEREGIHPETEAKEHKEEITLVPTETGKEHEEVIKPAQNQSDRENDTFEDENQPRRSARSNRGVPPLRLAYKACVNQTHEPQSWTEMTATEEPNKGHWLKAAQEEMDSLLENDTWELAELPEDKKSVGCRWTFKLKYDAQGKVNRHKARLVAKGYSQKYGEEYDEVFAPVVKQSTVRTLFTIAGAKKLMIRHLDVKTAFLHGDISEDVYMEQPEGYIKPGEEGLVCKLKKCIYGLKQSAREWNFKINEALTRMGYSRSKADPCLYSKDEHGKWTYILIYVDDLLICHETEDRIDGIINVLNKSFKVKDLGNATFYLGIQIQRNEDGSYLFNQETKINNILEKYGMKDAKNATTPMTQEYRQLTGEDDALQDNEEYRQAVGALLYIAISSRPDIAASMGMLCRRVSNPRQRDWTALKRVMRYLKGTIHAKLRLGNQDTINLTGYVDADWAGDNEDRKSVSGYVFQIGNSPISWCSRKQTAVALSTTEAEYMAAAHASQEAVWLRLLLKDFGYEQEDATQLHEDNQGCIKIALNERANSRTKHIDVKYHHLRDLQEKKVINLSYCPTEDMLADVLTKPLPSDRFNRLTEAIGLTRNIC